MSLSCCCCAKFGHIVSDPLFYPCERQAWPAARSNCAHLQIRFREAGKFHTSAFAATGPQWSAPRR